MMGQPTVWARVARIDAESRCCRLFKGNHGVGGQAGEEGACPIALKFCFHEVPEGTQGMEGKTGHQEGVFRKVERLQDIGKKPLLMIHKGL